MAFPDERDRRLQAKAKKALDGAAWLSRWFDQHRSARHEDPGALGPADEFELLQLRRRAEHLSSSASTPVGAAVFGPSQSGKSLLVGHVLRPREKGYSPLGRDEALGEPAYYPGLSFTVDLNPRCGALEATALVTRFTTRDRITHGGPTDYPVVALTLTRADWLRVLARGFLDQCDWVQHARTRWDVEAMEGVLRELSAAPANRGEGLDRQWRMDLADAYDYMRQHDPHWFVSTGADLGGLLARYPLSDAGAIRLAARLFWDGWDSLTGMFRGVLDFLRSQIAPRGEGRAVLLSHWPGVRFLLDSQRSMEFRSPNSKHFPELNWSDFRLEQSGGWTVLDHRAGRGGNPVDLALLQAALLEVVIPVLPDRLEEDWREVLKSIDLLDIPGMVAGVGAQQGRRRSAETPPERLEIVKRGKVLYLFDRYVDELQVQTLLMLISGSNLQVQGQMRAAVDRWGRARYGRDWTKVGDPDPALLIGLTGIDADFRNDVAHPGKNLYNNRFEQIVDTLGDVLRNFDGRGTPFQNIFPIRYPGTWDTDASGRVGPASAKWDDAREAFLGAENVRKHVRVPADRWDAAMDDDDGGLSLVSAQILKATSALSKQDHLEAEVGRLDGRLESMARAWVVAEGVQVDRQQREELGRKVVDWLSDRDYYPDRVEALTRSLGLGEADALKLADLEEAPTRGRFEGKPNRTRRAIREFLEDWRTRLVPLRGREQLEKARQGGPGVDPLRGLDEQDFARLARYLGDYLLSPAVFDTLAGRLERILFLEQPDETARKHARRRYAPLILNDFVLNPGPDVPAWPGDRPVEECEYGLFEPFIVRWKALLADRLADGAGDAARIPPGNAELRGWLDGPA